jgi:hypothetical protein
LRLVVPSLSLVSHASALWKLAAAIVNLAMSDSALEVVAWHAAVHLFVEFQSHPPIIVRMSPKLVKMSQKKSDGRKIIRPYLLVEACPV